MFKNIEISTAEGGTKSKTMGAIISSQCGALVDSLMQCQPHYVRCMKSNDEKKAGLYDKDRMVHQVQYLGLFENVKVRRAGFAYRAEFYRFLERFKLLSKKTYPYYTGSDLEGVKAIIKETQKRLPEINADEVKFGKTMIFIKKPETFNALEQLRDKVKGEFAAKIQRQFRRYHSRKWFIKLKILVTDFFSKNKERRRESVFRPFMGIYVQEVEYVKAVKSIISQSGKDKGEKVLFMDYIEKIVSNKALKNGISFVKRILCITQYAIYSMEVCPEPQLEREKKMKVVSTSKVFLRRKLSLDQLDAITLSTLADNYIFLKMTPQNKLPTLNITSWVPDTDSDTCYQCTTKFGLFTRKHHCRACGKLFCADCSTSLMKVPDLGHYEPVRVCDSCYRSVLIPQEMMEDWILNSSKKTEMVAILMDMYKKTVKKNLRVDFSDKCRPRCSQILSENLDVDFSFKADGKIGDEYKTDFEGSGG